jgi:hypothetical protein
MGVDRYPGLRLKSLGEPLEQVIYTLAEEGADEVVGPSEGPDSLWAALMRDGSEIVHSVREHLAGDEASVDAGAIEPGDWNVLEQAAGVIVMREGTGRVSVQAYRADEDLAAAWTAILADVEPDEPGSAAVKSPDADDNPT